MFLCVTSECCCKHAAGVMRSTSVIAVRCFNTVMSQFAAHWTLDSVRCWRQCGLMLPLLQQLVDAVGWQACSRSREVYCSDRSAAFQHRDASVCGSLDAQRCLLYGRPGATDYLRLSQQLFYPDAPAGLSALTPPHGYFHISIPGTFLDLSCRHRHSFDV